MPLSRRYPWHVCMDTDFRCEDAIVDVEDDTFPNLFRKTRDALETPSNYHSGGLRAISWKDCPCI